jgi:hypothetical protein
MGEESIAHNHSHHTELVERIGRTLREDGAIEPMPGLHLFRVSAPSGPTH